MWLREGVRPRTLDQEQEIAMNQKVAKLINEQINHEFYSAYLYLDFAN